MISYATFGPVLVTTIGLAILLPTTMVSRLCMQCLEIAFLGRHCLKNRKGQGAHKNDKVMRWVCVCVYVCVCVCVCACVCVCVCVCMWRVCLDNIYAIKNIFKY